MKPCLFGHNLKKEKYTLSCSCCQEVFTEKDLDRKKGERLRFMVYLSVSTLVGVLLFTLLPFIKPLGRGTSLRDAQMVYVFASFILYALISRVKI